MPRYGDDLAYIHDVGFGGFVERATPGLLAILRRHGIRGGRVVDLGCGTGIWAQALADRGYSVHGIDLSSAMIRRCRERVPEGTFRRASFFDAPVPSCRAVTSLGECLSYRLDDANTVRTRRALFRRVYGALPPGGLFICDVSTPGIGVRAGETSQRHWLGKDWAICVTYTCDEGKRRFERDIVTFRKKAGGGYARSREIHRIRLFPPREFAGELRRVGFRVTTSRRYGALMLGPGHRAFIARKP